MLFHDRKFCILHSGFSNFFLAVSIYMVLDDHHPFVRLLFQMGPNVIQHFIIDHLHFEHLQMLRDTCIYRVRLGPFNTIFCFIGVEAASRCDYRSKVDFVHFIWDPFERVSARIFAVSILPSDNAATPLNLSSASPANTKIVYLKYYRALSDGLCLDKRNCTRCMVKHRLSLQMLCCCRQAEGDCSCTACKRQPPSLRDICADKYFRDMRQFLFTTSTTFDQYEDAVDSRVPWQRLLPPGFPSIHISFTCNSSKINFTLLVPEYGYGIAKFLVRLTLIQTLFWH